MPRYNFNCEKCNNEFELSLTLEEQEKDSDKKVCPVCGTKNITQAITRSFGVSVSSTKSKNNYCQMGDFCSKGQCPMDE